MENVLVSDIEDNLAKNEDDFAALYINCNEGDFDKKWKDFLSKAHSYPYGESDLLSGALPAQGKWPKSLYEALGNNCNTFARWAIEQAGLKWANLPGNHPGNDHPRDVNTKNYEINSQNYGPLILR
jgi:hypothetical protein